MSLATKMAMAAKLAEERIRLDVGDDISIEEEVMSDMILNVNRVPSYQTRAVAWLSGLLGCT